MANCHDSPLDVLLAALKEATPKTPLTDVVATHPVQPAGTSVRGVIAPPPAAFIPTLALSRHRELFAQFVAATGVDLAANHHAAALLTQLHTLADGINTYVGDACEELYSACEGLKLFVSLMGQSNGSTADGSQVRGLLRPLMCQFDRATCAVGKLL